MSENGLEALGPLLLSMYQRYIDGLREGNLTCYKKACDVARKGLDVYAKKRVPEMFKEVIKEFYADYSPENSGDLHYRRNGSLYDLLSIKEDAEGYIKAFEYDPAKMKTTFRNATTNVVEEGEHSLYEYVFVQGWHGGAPKSKSLTDTKYYRAPFPADYKDNPSSVAGWRRWGAAAKRAPISPYQAIDKKIQEASRLGGEFSEEYGRLANEEYKKEYRKLLAKLAEDIVRL